MTRATERVRRDMIPLLPPTTRAAVSHWYGGVQRRWRHRMSWSQWIPTRLEPISDVYGSERGTPVDRVFLRRFVEQQQAIIAGDVLEMERPEWTGMVDRSRIGNLELLDRNPENPAATLIADLCADDPFGRRTFDCELVLQTLQYLPDVPKALSNLFGALRPGGTLLLSVPVISRLDYMCGVDGDLVRYTPSGLDRLLQRELAGAEIETFGFGNLPVAIGFLEGRCAEELQHALLRYDHRFPIISCAVIHKP